MTKEQKREAKIIFDKPATEDAFDGGGHQRSAEALANSIEQLSNRDGAIGLEGQWGAGKTTVINLAKKILKQNKDHEYYIFPFDLWEHQSDNFRRSFLEEFVNWAKNKKLLKLKEAKKAKDRIRDRVKRINSHHYKEYNIFGIVFLLFVPLSPFIAGTITSIIRYSLSQPEETYKPITIDAWNYGAYFLSTIYALFLLRIVWNIMFFKEKDSNGCLFEGGERLKRIFSKSISMFSKDIEKEGLTQSIRDSDPTTIEFHSIFREILSSIQKNNKRLVFVLDNIDRLQKEHVPNIWSEIRALFSNSAFNKNNSWVTAVIPYDRNFINSAFNKTTHSEKTSAATEGNIITKTFNITIHISPPVATDWRGFLEKHLDKSFNPSLDKKTKFNLFNLLDYYFQDEVIHPTPRQIIAYINGIIPLYMQWGDVIKPESIALYVLHRFKFENNPKAIHKKESINPRYQNIAEIEDWQKDFATLIHNVHPDNANQVYLEPYIIKALSQENHDDLIELSEATGFSDVIQKALEIALGNAGNNTQQISQIANNLSKIKKIGENRKKSVWKKMGEKLKATEDLDINISATFSGLFKIVEQQEKTSILKSAKDLEKALFNSIYTDTDIEEDTSKIWLNSISQLGDLITEGLGEDKKEKFITNTKLPNNINICKDIAYICSTKENISFNDFTLTINKQEFLDSFTTDDINSPEEAQKFYKILDQIKHLLDDSTCIKYLDIINSYLRSTDIIEVNDNAEKVLNSYIKLYSYIRKKDQTKQNLINLVNDGTLYFHGQSAQSAENHEAVASIQWMVTTALNTTPPSSLPKTHPTLRVNLANYANWYTQSITQEEQVNALAELISKYGSYSDWENYAIKDTTANNFYKKIFSEIIRKGTYKKINVKNKITRYADIKNIIGEELSLIDLKNFTGWSTYFEDKFSEDEIYEIPSEFIEDIYELEKEEIAEYKLILNLIDSKLRKLTQEQWEESLDEEDDALRLLIARNKTNNLTLSVEIYRPALFSHAIKVLEGKTEPSEYINDWNNALNALKGASRKKLSKDIFNKLPNIIVTKDGCEIFIKLYAELAENMPYTSNPDCALDQVFSNIISNDNSNIVDFIKKSALTIKECLQKSDGNSSKGFEESLESLEEVDDEDKQEYAAKLRKMLGLKPKPANDEDIEKKAAQ
ncbi:MAG: hypothetical protein GY793_00145 [Proteobacteria bacterium]|nr:hypothetical protein [Pseudomonadota bacterium]